ncbi:MAG TPA: glycosyltransferase family 4 protein [Sphingomicrobium sp.]|nr:glycosyltransferase family 4 protein [Sphingomicrobium sp.]
MAYTVELVRQKSHHQFFHMRHSGGYFARVWGVHPISDVAGKKSRIIETIAFSERQTIIEGVAESLPLPRFLLPLNFLVSQGRLVRRLRRLIGDEAIDLILSTDCYYSGLLGLLLKRLTGRPQVVAVYGNQDDLYTATGALAMPRLLPFRWLERRIARFVLSRANLVIAASRNNMSFAIANGARGYTAIIPVAKNIEDIHLVPPEERTVPDAFARFAITSGAPVMLYVGRLLALKHPDEAVRAMAAVIRERPDGVGLLAGSGPMKAQLEQLIDDLGMRGRIHFLGLIDQRQLARLTPHCITLSPLTGMALIECGLGGSPMVAFDRDWQAEFVEDGVNGFIVPFLDHDAMADRALRLIDDPQLRARMSRAARERALEYCNRDHIYAKEHEQFDRLLSERA